MLERHIIILTHDPDLCANGCQAAVRVPNWTVVKNIRWGLAGNFKIVTELQWTAKQRSIDCVRASVIISPPPFRDAEFACHEA